MLFVICYLMIYCHLAYNNICMYIYLPLPFLQSMIRLLLSGPVESFTFFCNQQQLIYCRNNPSYIVYEPYATVCVAECIFLGTVQLILKLKFHVSEPKNVVSHQFLSESNTTTVAQGSSSNWHFPDESLDKKEIRSVLHFVGMPWLSFLTSSFRSGLPTAERERERDIEGGWEGISSQNVSIIRPPQSNCCVSALPLYSPGSGCLWPWLPYWWLSQFGALRTMVQWSLHKARG